MTLLIDRYLKKKDDSFDIRPNEGGSGGLLIDRYSTKKKSEPNIIEIEETKPLFQRIKSGVKSLFTKKEEKKEEEPKKTNRTLNFLAGIGSGGVMPFDPGREDVFAKDILAGIGSATSGTIDLVTGLFETLENQQKKNVQAMTDPVEREKAMEASFPTDARVSKVTRDFSKKIKLWSQEMSPENPDFADQLMQGVGSMGLFAAANAVSGGSTIVPVVLESMGEAGSVYEANREEGVSIEESGEKASFTFGLNLILNKFLNVFDIPNKEVKVIAKLIRGSGTEAVQEGSQQVISNIYTNRPVLEGVPESMGVGAVLGGGTSVVLPSGKGGENKEYQQRKEEVKFEPVEIVRQEARVVEVDEKVVEAEKPKAVGGVGDVKSAEEWEKDNFTSEQIAKRRKLGVDPNKEWGTMYRGTSRAEWNDVQTTGTFGNKSNIEGAKGKTWVTDDPNYIKGHKAIQADMGDDSVTIEFKPEAKVKTTKMDSGEGSLGRGLILEDVARVTDKNGKVIYDAKADTQPKAVGGVEVAKTPKQILEEIGISKHGPQGKALSESELNVLGKYLKEQGGDELRGTIYRPYGGGQDVVFGTIKNRNWKGQTEYLVMNDSGAGKGMFRLHSTPIEKSSIIGKTDLSQPKAVEKVEKKAPAKLSEDFYKQATQEKVAPKQPLKEKKAVVSKPPALKEVTTKQVETTKDIKGVKETLKNIRNELSAAVVEAEGQATVAQEQRAGLDTTDIAKLKSTIAVNKKLREGDIETVRASKAGKRLNRVIENVQEVHPEMSEADAYEFALNLPTKAQESPRTSVIRELEKKEKKLSKFLDLLKARQNELKIKADEELSKEWERALAVQEKLIQVINVPSSQVPVGRGVQKVSRLEARLKSGLDAASQEQIDELGLSTYNQANQKEQIALAMEYTQANPDDALRVLSGEIAPPKGILKNAIYGSLVELGSQDTAIATKVATAASTRFGQEINILKTILADNPVVMMQDVVDVRIKAYEKRTGKKATERVKKEIDKITKEVKAPDRSEWDSFIEKIRC